MTQFHVKQLTEHKGVRITARRSDNRPHAGNVTVAATVQGTTISALIGCDRGQAFVAYPPGAVARDTFDSFDAALDAARKLIVAAVDAELEARDQQRAHQRFVDAYATQVDAYFETAETVRKTAT